jgi:hypothetical protein
MATKQKLNRERLGAILHKHNLKRFEGFHQHLKRGKPYAIGKWWETPCNDRTENTND